MTPEEIAHLQRLAQAQQEQQRQQFSQHLASEQEKLLDAIPLWRSDPELAAREMGEIRQHMVEKHKFTPDELAVIPHHRAVLAMKALYDGDKREADAKRRAADDKARRERQQKAEAEKAAEKGRKLDEARKTVRKHPLSTHHGAQALADALDEE
jgi:hypothetical protein